MATTSLRIHYYIQDGHRDTVLSKLKGVIDLCAKEPEFINAIISESPERPNQFALQELWHGAPISMRYRASSRIAKPILQT
jgi:quinol monooxygenase YgiN